MAQAIIRKNIVLRRAVLILFTVVSCGFAIQNEPFPGGSRMGHLGTIMYATGTGSHGCGVSPVYLGREPAAGGTVGGVAYYDAMDNYRDRSIAQLSAGGWVCRQQWAASIAVTHFDALGAYYEQEGYFAGSVVLPWGVRAGCAVRGIRMKIADPAYDAAYTGTGDATVLVPLKPLFLTFGVEHLLLNSAHIDGADPQLQYTFGLHTEQHAFGAQGVRLVLLPHAAVPVVLALGQEIRLHKRVALHVAIASNPFLFAMGVEVGLGAGGVNVALVSHPVLGWSKGFSMGYQPFRHRE